jgi:hypothetical protein
MSVKIGFARVLAIAGAVLLGLPVLAPFVLGLASLAGSGVFRFDFLLPAEVFPVPAAGFLAAFAAALIARRRRILIGAAFGAGLAALAGAQALAAASGLADGSRAAEGPLWYLAAGGLFGFMAALAVAAFGAGLLARDLFRPEA